VRQQQQVARMMADGHHAHMTGMHAHVNPSATATGVMNPMPQPAHADMTVQAMGRILVATDGRTVQEIGLKVGRIIVGRTTDNDVQIDSRFVSRHHCQVITTPQACVIEDLNSTNGIYVKSKRVRRHYLNDGDVVLIGKHELIYIDERLPRSRAPFIETAPGMPPMAVGSEGEASEEEANESS
jgi:pSer/pThr/pTyr-binding forkhead associated (FHA) protein